MPNRIIKESICTSDNLNMLSAEEERFFTRLLVTCDDYGIADARTAIILAKCFPLKIREISEEDITEWLNALVAAGLVFLYKVDGKPYLKMTSWEKHQQIRAKKSKFPLPDENAQRLISDDIMRNQMNAHDDAQISDDCICPRNPIQSNPNPNTNIAHDENAQLDGAQKMNAQLYAQQAEELWLEYPEKKDKSRIIKKLPALVKEYGLDQMKRAVERYINYVESEHKRGFDLHYKNGSTFFNGSFKDYLDDVYEDVPDIPTKNPWGDVSS